MRINTNVASLNAQNQNAQTNNNLTSSLEKLSSGLKINKAADDASGMAIADKLRMQASSIGQGIENANSGNALITIADKALGEQSKMLDTIKTKLLQASTSTTSAEGREAIRKDIQKLLEQVNNISEQTTYNGVNLLNEKGADFSFTVGEKSTDVISMKTAYAVNTEGLGSSERDFANSGVIHADDGGVIAGLAIEGEATDAKLTVGSTAGSTIGVTFSAGGSVMISGNNVTQLSGGAAGMIITTENVEDIAFLNAQADFDDSDGLTKIADGVYSFTAGVAFSAGGIALSHNFSDVTVTMTGTAAEALFGFQGATESDIQKVSGSNDIIVRNATKAEIDGDTADGIGFGDQVMLTEGTMSIHADVPGTDAAIALNTVLATTIGNSAELAVTVASESVVQSISIHNSLGSGSVLFSTTDGETAAALESAGLTANSDGKYEWSQGTATTSNKITFGGTGVEISNLTIEGITKSTAGGNDKLFFETTGSMTIENLNNSTGNSETIQNGIAVQVAQLTAGGVSSATVSTGFSASMTDSGLGASQLSGLMSLGEDKLTAETAKNFMSVIDDAMTQLNTVRSDFGSTQGQLKVAIDNMMTTQVNLKAAESVIRDVDYAAESANFNKQNIIAQAGTYAMSQANAMQQNVLRLLQ
jgi:flagellin